MIEKGPKLAIMSLCNAKLMKLLIVTQKVDKNDPILGFFHRWIIEFAKHCESVTVICLEKGIYELSSYDDSSVRSAHGLPANVRVLSLGKEQHVSRAAYIWRFYSYIWKERKNYETVFVHMNPIYVVLGGWVWKILGKKMALWYTHKNVDWKLRIAEKIADKIFSASKESFRLKSKKVFVTGHGIDLDFFCPSNELKTDKVLLSVGRLMPTKRHDLAIMAAAQARLPLRIIGDGPERKNLETLSRKLGSNVDFLGSLTQSQTRDEYRKASFLIHTSETGSLDKVVLEALACGLGVISTSTALSDLPITIVSPTPDSIAREVSNVRQINTDSSILYVRRNHSLQNLIPKIMELIRNI